LAPPTLPDTDHWPAASELVSFLRRRPSLFVCNVAPPHPPSPSSNDPTALDTQAPPLPLPARPLERRRPSTVRQTSFSSIPFSFPGKFLLPRRAHVMFTPQPTIRRFTGCVGFREKTRSSSAWGSRSFLDFVTRLNRVHSATISFMPQSERGTHSPTRSSGPFWYTSPSQRYLFCFVFFSACENDAGLELQLRGIVPFFATCYTLIPLPSFYPARPNLRALTVPDLIYRKSTVGWSNA